MVVLLAPHTHIFTVHRIRIPGSGIVNWNLESELLASGCTEIEAGGDSYLQEWRRADMTCRRLPSRLRDERFRLRVSGFIMPLLG